MAQSETTAGGPGAYDLARQAIAAMHAHKVWPTPTNFQLWLEYVSDPTGAVAGQINDMVQSGEPITESRTEALAATLLPGSPVVAVPAVDTGKALHREIEAVAVAIAAAKQSSQTYGASLEGASRGLAAPVAEPDIRRILDTLSDDTHLVNVQHRTLEQRLHESKVEAVRLRDSLEQGKRDVYTDALTGLHNRKAFDEALQRAWQTAASSQSVLTLAMLDIDHFKRFNDTWGHQTGDHVLRFVASIIDRAARAPRFAGRYGGEEFAVIFAGEGGDAAFGCLEIIRQEVAGAVLKRRTTNEDLGPVTLSAGVVVMRRGDTVHGLIERADAALYAAKYAGRNQVRTDESANLRRTVNG